MWRTARGTGIDRRLNVTAVYFCFPRWSVDPEIEGSIGTCRTPQGGEDRSKDCAGLACVPAQRRQPSLARYSLVTYYVIDLRQAHQPPKNLERAHGGHGAGPSLRTLDWLRPIRPSADGGSSRVTAFLSSGGHSWARSELERHESTTPCGVVGEVFSVDASGGMALLVTIYSGVSG